MVKWCRSGIDQYIFYSRINGYINDAFFKEAGTAFQNLHPSVRAHVPRVVAQDNGTSRRVLFQGFQLSFPKSQVERIVDEPGGYAGLPGVS